MECPGGFVCLTGLSKGVGDKPISFVAAVDFNDQSKWGVRMCPSG